MSDSTFQRPIEWHSHGGSHVGMVRKANEDSYLERPDRGLWAIADGMGGYRFGDMASRMIVEALDSVPCPNSLSDYMDDLEDAVFQINDQLLQLACESRDRGTMGSTLIALVIRNRVGVCLWAGDSRLYRFRGQQLVQLSRDHSQVQEMLEMGLLDAEQVNQYPDRNVITRAVGVEENLCLDFNVFSTQVGDTYLLCSDGLYSVIEDAAIEKSLDQRDPQKTSEELIQQCLDAGAPDNVSVIVIRGNPGRIQPTAAE